MIVLCDRRERSGVLLDRVGAVILTGPIEYVRSNKHSGVRHMPVMIEPHQDDHT
jgi:hypothetical protein